MMQEVYIVSCARTPIGAFRGSLSALTAPQLGSTAIKAALEKIALPSDAVQEVFMGNVLQGNLGQAPARQAALGAGLSTSTPCTAVNKVCASGMKAIVFGAQSIQLGQNDIVVCGGMESMSNVPYYLKRGDTPYGGVTLTDGLVSDGLTDAYKRYHMGECAEKVAKDFKLTREQQDDYAIKSYERSIDAAKNGVFAKEIVPVTIPGKRGKPDVVVDADEEYSKFDAAKLKKLNPVFQKDGTVTAGNASSLSDGAAACILMSEKAVKAHNVKPLAKIVAYGDGGVDPVDFPIAPAFAVEKVLKRANKNIKDVSLWEVNEAFSVVALSNMIKLGLDINNVNVYGGGVSIGHPLGMSGARIVNVLALHLKTGEIGVAGICNGGGGATALMVEKL